MEPWPSDDVNPALFDALPVSQQRMILLLVRALVHYLEQHPEDAAGLD